MALWNNTVKLITGVEPKSSVKKPKTVFGRKKPTRRELIRRESAIGSQLFGPIPAGHRREFFCLDENTWIWYEEWVDNNRQCELTTRYEIHPNGVLKVQDGKPYSVVEGAELKNLVSAVRQYHDRVAREIYQRDPISGKALVI